MTNYAEEALQGSRESALENIATPARAACSPPLTAGEEKKKEKPNNKRSLVINT